MEKKRVVIKIGSSSLQHPETGKIDFLKMERLVRELCDLRNRGLDVCLVSSGAIAAGRMFMGIKELPMHIAKKQACASVGQARLMMTYQKLFAEYHQTGFSERTWVPPRSTALHFCLAGLRPEST